VCNDTTHLVDAIAAVGNDALDEGEGPARLTQHLVSTIALLDIGGMYHDANKRPSVSTRMCRLRPLTSCPRRSLKDRANRLLCSLDAIDRRRAPCAAVSFTQLDIEGVMEMR
jgi:hypothetical protein